MIADRVGEGFLIQQFTPRCERLAPSRRGDEASGKGSKTKKYPPIEICLPDKYPHSENAADPNHEPDLLPHFKNKTLRWFFNNAVNTNPQPTEENLTN